ncbi:putative exonuclease GOR [Styela clava]
MSEEEIPSKRRRVLDQKDISSKVNVKVLYNKILLHRARPVYLDRYGYPRPDGQHPEKAKFSNLSSVQPINDSDNKTCVRCEKSFLLTESIENTSDKKCVYHKRRSYQGKPHDYCGRRRGSRGCRTADNHVHNDNLRDPSNYIATIKKTIPDDGSPGIYSIDGEMSYTVKGRTLTKFTVVDHNGKVICNEFANPVCQIIDYNTEFSGITKSDTDGTTTILKDVQNFCLEKFSSDTVLIGHAVECNLIALRLIHETIVDTAIVFPHPRGLPHMRALRTLGATFRAVLTTAERVLWRVWILFYDL